MLHVSLNPTKPLIMIVEDNQSQAFYLEHILTSSSYDIVLAKDGSNAIEMMTSGTIPDALITDLNMPKKNGFELIAEMRKHKLTIPIIITSGSSDNNNFERAFVLGAQSYLVKPYPPHQLLAKLNFLLSKQSHV